MRCAICRIVSMLVFSVLLFSSWASAQRTTATLYGVVQDASNAVVPGANVVVLNEATGGRYPAVSNEQGEFTVGFLPVGQYTVEVDAAGFKRFKETGLRLVSGQELRYTVRMEVGELTQQVTVTGQAPIVQNVAPSILKTFSTEQVKELPLASRDWTRLLYLDPGMKGGEFSPQFNGLAARSNTFTVDGTEASSDVEQSTPTFYQNFSIVKTISLEAIEEVQVTKGVMTAETARTFSGNINLITKGGTNDFHGSVFYNWQNNILNARNLLNPAPGPKAPIRFHQFGGSAGGPIIKDKLFFFAVYEGNRDRNSSISNDQVYTKEFRDQAIAAVPAYKVAFDRMKLPTEPYAAGAQQALFRTPVIGSRKDNHAILRGDYRVTATNSVSTRYTRGRPYSAGQPSGGAQSQREFTGFAEVVTGSFTHFARTWSGETRFGLNHTYFNRIDSMWKEGKTPGWSLTGLPQLGGNWGGLYQGGWTWSIEQVVTKNMGRHTLKSGFLFLRRVPERQDDRLPTFNYPSVARFLANDPNRATFTFGNRLFHAISNESGAFFQDDFKLRPNLVLNLGLRYEYYSVLKEKDDMLFSPDGILGAVASPTRFRAPDKAYSPDRNNFSPRVGFAWTLDSGGKNVVRGGAGVYYVPFTLIDMINLVSVVTKEIPFRATLDQGEITRLGLKYPASNDEVRKKIEGTTFPRGWTTIPDNMSQPYNVQWTLDYQRQLAGSTALQLGYVGNHSMKLTILDTYNLADRLTNQRPFPGALEFQYIHGANSSYYHAMQVRLRQRFAAGLTGNLSYNWGRGIAYLGGSELGAGGYQNENCWRCDKAPYDRGHRIVGDWIYELPMHKWFGSNRALQEVFGGWQIAGIAEATSGNPINVTQSGRANARPDTSGSNPYSYTGYKGRYQWLNKAAFTLVPLSSVSNQPIRPGNVGKSAFIGPGTWNVDLSLARRFKLREGLNLQIRVDAMNGFNHFNLGNVDTNLNSSNFGLITGVGLERRMQLNARFVF